MANAVLYGFRNLQNIFTTPVTDVDVAVIDDAVNQSNAFYNRNLDAMLARLVERTTEYKAKYRSPTRHRLQPLDENGRPRATIPVLEEYGVAWPIWMAGDKWGANVIARLRMTVGQVNDHLLSIQQADSDWLRDEIFAAIFTNVSYVYDDPQYDDLTVMPLANGDTQKYWYVQSSPSGATANHFLAQAGAIADGTNPFPTMRALLARYPSQAPGPFVAMVPTANIAAVRGLTTFFERRDPNLSAALGVSELVGAEPANIPGEIIGYESSGMWISEWPFLPTDYLVGISLSGNRPLRMREDPEAVLRGLRNVDSREEYPWYDTTYIRRAGFGAWNRTGAVVQRVGNASYAVPANYLAPIP